MLYSQALAERAQAWLSRPLTAGPEGKRSAEGLLELATVWAAIQRQPLPECIRQCQYSERHADVAAYVREFSRLQNPATMSDTTTASKYQLAPAYASQTFNHEDYNGTLTADNLTDEGAEFFIGKGYGHAFTPRDGSALTSTDTAATSTDSTPAAPVTGDHAAELAKEQHAHTATTGKLNKEHEAHAKTSDALKAEKEAHKATKKELSEVSKQLAEAQKELTKLSDKAADAADKAAG